MATAPTCSTPASGLFAREVLNLNRVVPLRDLYTKAEILGLPSPPTLVRTITFRTGAGYGGAGSGVVTGIPLDPVRVGGPVGADTGRDLHILMVSGGCAHATHPYVIPQGAVIEEITSH